MLELSKRSRQVGICCHFRGFKLSLLVCWTWHFKVLQLSSKLGFVGYCLPRKGMRSVLQSAGQSLFDGVLHAGILVHSLLANEKYMMWNVYLSGEIHTDWREQVIGGCKARNLPIEFSSAVTDHAASDAAGDLLGEEPDSYWRDHKSAKVNTLRIRTLIQRCDIAVVRFGEQYKQWNAAFDAGCCAALNKPFITLHSRELVHPLKEVDAAAMAWATSSEQVVELLGYATTTK